MRQTLNINNPKYKTIIMSDKKPTLGFIGIGLMGKPMTLRLLNAGFSVNVWNRSPEKLTTCH